MPDSSIKRSSGPPPGWRLESEFGNGWRARLADDVLKAKVNVGDLVDMLGFVLDEQLKTAKQLMDRISELEKRPELKYAGIWSSDVDYQVGTFCTDGGSMWHARRASVGERPGTSDAWQLAVKHGKSAR